MSAQPPLPPHQPPPPQQPQPDYNRAAQEAMARVKAASQDALKAAMTLVYNPVGGLPTAYASLPGSAALGVGLVFMGVWLILSILGATFGASLPIPWSGVPFSYKLRAIILLLCIPGGMVLGMFVARMALKGAGSIAFDVFVAGAALLLVGVATFIGGILGGNIFGILMLAAFVLCVLVIFTALTRISGIKEGPAAYMTVGVFLVAGLLMKVMTSILF